ncbi:MAG: transglutaminase domain-containing protein, partial [Deltaproteobacteria bacterium]|nr:transglutaminase domain-containing protein [Deltaproteobacteria bacterium]
RDRVLRLAMGFIDLVIAAALTTDFYLFPMIMLIFIVASIYIATAFLETKFLEQYPEQPEVAIPAGFLKNMIGVSLAVFVVSLAIFPVLPRSTWRAAVSNDAGIDSIGYRNNVEVTPSAASSLLKKNHRPALIVTALRAGAPDPGAAMPLHLIRGSDLELFDGERWMARTTKLRVATVKASGNAADFEIALQPQLKSQLLLPYGSRIEAFTEPERYQYSSAVPGYRGAEAAEPPLELHTRVPNAIRVSGMAPVAQRIFRNAKTNTEKVRALLTFYGDKFQASLDPQPAAADAAGVLSSFLLNEKKGTCEMFATTAALLLRLSNVPTRLVAGFRVSRLATQGTLTVMDSDAHAWVEYWDETRGWMPFDPTPLVLVEEGWLDAVRESYWSLAVYWESWVLSYGKTKTNTANPAVPEAASKLSKQKTGFMETISGKGLGEQLGFAALLALALATLSYAALSLWRPWRSIGNRELLREYRRMARLLKRREQQRYTHEYQAWEAEYLRLRFGSQSESAAAHDVRELKRLRLALRADQ